MSGADGRGTFLPCPLAIFNKSSLQWLTPCLIVNLLIGMHVLTVEVSFNQAYSGNLLYLLVLSSWCRSRYHIKWIHDCKILHFHYELGHNLFSEQLYQFSAIGNGQRKDFKEQAKRKRKAEKDSSAVKSHSESF